MQLLITIWESPSIWTFWKLPVLSRIGPAKRACVSTELLVPSGNGEDEIARTIPLLSLTHAQRPDLLGYPLQTPSKLSFTILDLGGSHCTNALSILECWLLLIPLPDGIRRDFHSWIMKLCQTNIVGLILHLKRPALVTSDIDFSMPCNTISFSANSFLNILLFLSH